MEEKTENFDLICSLGGNCAVAHNLLMRKLRITAYPFDWTYFTSDEAVYKLAEGFRNDFANYMLKENLKELPLNSDHPDNIQYEDLYGKIVWANHFSYKEDRDKNYCKVKEKFDKRFKRLVKHVKMSKKILFIFSTSFSVKPDAFQYLLNELNELYPNKDFYIKVISFSNNENKEFEQEKLEIFYVKRTISAYYDFLQTSYEWNFLDNLKLSSVLVNEKQKKRTKISAKLFGYYFKLEWKK